MSQVSIYVAPIFHLFLSSCTIPNPPPTMKLTRPSGINKCSSTHNGNTISNSGIINSSASGSTITGNSGNDSTWAMDAAIDVIKGDAKSALYVPNSIPSSRFDSPLLFFSTN